MDKTKLAITVIVFLVTNQIQADISVNGYIRKNGTYVEPHYRSNPNNSVVDNWSYSGNINPHTGRIGTKTYSTPTYNHYQPAKKLVISPIAQYQPIEQPSSKIIYRNVNIESDSKFVRLNQKQLQDIIVYNQNITEENQAKYMSILTPLVDKILNKKVTSQELASFIDISAMMHSYGNLYLCFPDAINEMNADSYGISSNRIRAYAHVMVETEYMIATQEFREGVVKPAFRCKF